MSNELTIGDIKKMKRADLEDVISENELGINPSDYSKVADLRAAILKIVESDQSEDGDTETGQSTIDEGSPVEPKLKAKSSGDLMVYLNPAAPKFVSRVKCLPEGRKVRKVFSRLFQVNYVDCVDGYEAPDEELRDWMLSLVSPSRLYYFLKEEDLPPERGADAPNPLTVG